MGVLANEVVGLAAKVNKIMEAAGRLVTPVDDIRHVRGEDKGGTVPGPRGTHRQTVNTLQAISGDDDFPHPSSPVWSWIDGLSLCCFLFLP